MRPSLRPSQFRGPLLHLRPFRQGDLDGLCGIYAIVNAIRWALGTSSDLDDEDWQALFASLLRAAEKQSGTASAVTSGINTRPLRSLMRKAADYMADQHGLELKLSRPLKGKRKASLKRVIAELRRQADRPQTAVLIGLGGHLVHWSVVASVNAHFISLFDSSGHRRIRLDNCRAPHEQPLPTPTEHVIHPIIWVRAR